MALARVDDIALHWGARTKVMIEDVPTLRLLHNALASETVARRTRILALAFEIKVLAANASYEINGLAGTENYHWVKPEDRAKYRPLDDVQSFHVALVLARSAFGMITRVRALWDKLFLYVTLRFDGDAALQRLQNHRSKRKRFFSEYGQGIAGISAEQMSAALADINTLERRYRSPELHGFSVVPPWVFGTPTSWPDGHSSPIIGHWDAMRTFLHLAFAEADGKRTSFDRVIPESTTPG